MKTEETKTVFVMGLICNMMNKVTHDFLTFFTDKHMLTL